MGTPLEPQLISTLEELRQEGVLQRSGDRYELTRRWRAARHRASTSRELASASLEPGNPIVLALLASIGRRALATLGPHVAILFALESSERNAGGSAVSKR